MPSRTVGLTLVIAGLLVSLVFVLAEVVGVWDQLQPGPRQGLGTAGGIVLFIVGLIVCLLDRGSALADRPLHLDALLVYIEWSSIPSGFLRRRQLGLYFLAQYACDAGYMVRVENLSSNDLVVQKICRLANEHRCRLVGFYVDHENLWSLRRALPAIKDRLPEVDIILGGPQMTMAPELVLEQLPQAICGVIGDGEETFVELLSFPSLDPAILRDCSGLAIRTADGIERTTPRSPIERLDDLTVPRLRELTLDPGDTNRSVMIVGRGCAGQCAFCYESRKVGPGKKLRLHSAEWSLEQFDYLVREMQSKYIGIQDDTFVADTNRLKAFCKGLKERYDGEIKWFCEARVDTLDRNPDLLPLMIDAGLVRLQVGGESGCQRILDAYNKGTTLKQMRSVVDAARNHGLLSLTINFMIGGAFETRDTFEETRDFAIELIRRAPGCVGVGASLYTPFPGTPMYENPEAYGIFIIDKEAVTGPVCFHPICHTEQLSRFEILALVHEFQRCIDKTMQEAQRTLARDVVERHFRAFHDLGASSEWHAVLSEHPNVRGYYDALFRAGALPFAEADAAGFKGMYPYRTIDLKAAKEDRFLVSGLDGIVRDLDALESRVLELSAGKLAFDDITELVVQVVPNLSSTKIRDTVKKCFARLDNEHLVVWRNGTK